MAVTGPSLSRRYKDQVPGDTIEGVAMSRSEDWGLVWDRDLNPLQSVIVQTSQDTPESVSMAFQVATIRKFFNTQKASVPSLLYVDEGMDFFTPNGVERFGGAIQRCYRAGRERGLATLAGFQRPKAISMQCLTEMNVLYLFRLNYRNDIKRLIEMGLPEDTEAPTENHRFLYMRKGKLLGKELTLGIG